MTNEELVIRIQSGEDVGNNMALLYGQVKNFIRSIAWQYRDSGEMEDLEQEGYLALYPAITSIRMQAVGSLPMQHLGSGRQCGAICRTAAAVCGSRCIAWNRFRRCRNIKPNITENTVVMRQMPRFAALWVLPLNRSRDFGKTPV